MLGAQRFRFEESAIWWTFDIKIAARPQRTSLWFTGIEYSWCTNLAISVVAWFYQCISLQCSCDALQLVTLSRNISYHLAKLYWIPVEIFSPLLLQNRSHLLPIFPCIIVESQVLLFRRNCRFFFSTLYHTDLKETEETIRKCKACFQRASRVPSNNRITRKYFSEPLRSVFGGSFDFRSTDGGIRLYVR